MRQFKMIDLPAGGSTEEWEKRVNDWIRSRPDAEIRWVQFYEINLRDPFAGVLFDAPSPVMRDPAFVEPMEDPDKWLNDLDFEELDGE